MAKAASTGVTWRPERHKKTTSIGKSVRSIPKSKNAKRQFKKYRGQGR